MKALMAGEIARIVDGRLVGSDVPVGPDVVIDSRLVTPGALFVAIAGARVDGHDYLGSVADSGGAAALVDHAVEARLPQIVVADTIGALSALARHIAAEGREHGLVSLALTGSSGKTSTKDMLAQVLEPAGVTVAPRGSFNNKITMPLTVTGVDESTRFLVAEMGATKIGHIEWLCSISRPGIAAVLNVGHAHIGEFGSREAIAQAKGEIVEGLPDTGWAVLNADDPLVTGMAGRTKAQVAWFSAAGAGLGGDIWAGARDVRLDDLDRASFRLVGHAAGAAFDQPVRLRTLGAHQVANACAAAVMALCAGLAPDAVAVALSSAVARSSWRMEPVNLADGRLVLNDAYNANPDSVAAALASLGRLARSRSTRPVAVLGDMLELGPAAEAAHETAGRLAVEAGATVIAVGEFAQFTAAGARRAGGEAFVMARDDVADWLARSSARVVLVKGSRGVGLDSIVTQWEDRQ